MSLETTGSRCEQLARQWQIFGRVIPAAETVAKIEAVTEADIRAVAREDFPHRGRRWRPSGPIGQVPKLSDIIDRLAGMSVTICLDQAADLLARGQGRRGGCGRNRA